MPPTTLRLEFGGLCLFVQRDNPAGLYVMMPRLNRGPHIPAHCPILAMHDAQGRGVAVRFDNQELDLTGLAPHAGRVSVPDGFAMISEYASGRRVRDELFTNNPPRDPLAARVRLPLGTVMNPFGDSALMLVPPRGDEKQLCGRVWVEVEVAELPDLPIDLGSGVIISLLNIPVHDLRNPHQRYRHERGKEAEHLQAYYWLLEGDSGGPPIRMGRDENSECPPHAPHVDCAFVPGRVVIPRTKAGGCDPTTSATPEFIDPYTCTVGYSN